MNKITISALYAGTHIKYSVYALIRAIVVVVLTGVTVLTLALLPAEISVGIAGCSRVAKWLLYPFAIALITWLVVIIVPPDSVRIARARKKMLATKRAYDNAALRYYQLMSE